MELKVINEIRDELKTFNTVEQFDSYYRSHKDDVNKHTTQYLNRVYKINTPDGLYRITKKNCVKVDGKLTQGEIFLKKIKTSNTDTNTHDFTQLANSITDLQNQVDTIKNALNEVIKVVNGQ